MKVLYIFLFILLSLQYIKNCGGEGYSSGCACANKWGSHCCYSKSSGKCTTRTSGDGIECCNSKYYSNYLGISFLSLLIILLLL